MLKESPLCSFNASISMYILADITKKSSNLRTFCRKIANFWFTRRGQFLSEIWMGGSLYFSMTGFEFLSHQLLSISCIRHGQNQIPLCTWLCPPKLIISARTNYGHKVCGLPLLRCWLLPHQLVFNYPAWISCWRPTAPNIPSSSSNQLHHQCDRVGRDASLAFFFYKSQLTDVALI